MFCFVARWSGFLCHQTCFYVCFLYILAYCIYFFLFLHIVVLSVCVESFGFFLRKAFYKNGLVVSSRWRVVVKWCIIDHINCNAFKNNVNFVDFVT